MDIFRKWDRIRRIYYTFVEEIDTWGRVEGLREQRNIKKAVDGRKRGIRVPGDPCRVVFNNKKIIDGTPLSCTSLVFTFNTGTAKMAKVSNLYIYIYLVIWIVCF